MRKSFATLLCMAVMALFVFGKASAWSQPDLPDCPDFPKGCIPRIDFDTFCNGRDVPPGFVIKEKSEQLYGDFGVKFGVDKFSGDSKFDPKKNVLMTFDTKNPRGQKDLGAPNTGCPGCQSSSKCPGFCDGQKPGQDPKKVSGDCGGASNCDKLGNVLIISADGNQDKPRAWDDKGGVIRVDFEKPVKLDYLRLLNADRGDKDNGYVKIYYGSQSDKKKIPNSGDNGISKVKLDNYKDIKRIEIDLVGRTALVDIVPDNKDRCPDVGPDPDDDIIEKICFCRCTCRESWPDDGWWDEDDDGKDGAAPDPQDDDDDGKHTSGGGKGKVDTNHPDTGSKDVSSAGLVQVPFKGWGF